MLKKVANPLSVILLLALLLRLIGIQHGFPYVFHPDEPAVVRTALALRFDLNPHHFDWPHLFIYLNFFLYKFIALFRDIAEDAGYKYLISQFLPLFWNDKLVFYLLSRLLSGVVGALTIFPVYLTGKNLFNKRIGLFSALAMALIPFHVRHSHYALIDVPATFFLSWAMYFCTNIMTRKRVEDFIVAGLFVGFAASTKYNAGLSAILVPLAYLFRVLKEKERLISFEGINNMLLSGVSALFGFLIGTPFALFDFGTFIRTDGPAGALWQFTNVGKLSLWENIESFFTSMWVKLSKDFGYTFLVVYWFLLITGAVSLLKRVGQGMRLNVWFLLIPSLIFFFYISGFEKNRSHYYMITYPFVALAVGYVVNSFLQKSKQKSVVRFVIYLLVVLIYFIPFYFAIMNIVDLSKPVEDIYQKTIYGGDIVR